MAKPHSSALRRRVLQELEAGMGLSEAQRVFGVSRSTLHHWRTVKERTGRTTPTVIYPRGQAHALLDLQALADFAHRRSRCSLEQMVQDWERQTGQKLSVAIMSKWLRRIGWTSRDKIVKMPLSRPLSSQELKMQGRLSVLLLAKQVGVSEACRRTQMGRAQFYEYKKRFDQEGLEGLRDRCVPSFAIESQVRGLVLAHPALSEMEVQEQLAGTGTELSLNAIRRILLRLGLNTPCARWLQLEVQAAPWLTNSLRQRQESPFAISPPSLTPEQFAFLQGNAMFDRRDYKAQSPGELLSQFVFALCPEPRKAKRQTYTNDIFLHGVIDHFSSMVWCRLTRHSGYAIREAPGPAHDLLLHEVLPFFQNCGLPVGAIVTREDSTFFDLQRHADGLPYHPYRVLLLHNGIIHHRRASTEVNVWVERFRLQVWQFLDANWPQRSLKAPRPIVAEEIGQKLGTWLKDYNTRRPHAGYRNQGHPPLSLVRAFLTARKQK